MKRASECPKCEARCPFVSSGYSGFGYSGCSHEMTHLAPVSGWYILMEPYHEDGWIYRREMLGYCRHCMLEFRVWEIVPWAYCPISEHWEPRESLMRMMEITWRQPTQLMKYWLCFSGNRRISGERWSGRQLWNKEMPDATWGHKCTCWQCRWKEHVKEYRRWVEDYPRKVALQKHL